MANQIPQNHHSGPRWSKRAGIALGEVIMLTLAGFVGAGVCREVEHGKVVNTSLGCVETVITRADAPTGMAMVQGGDMDFRDDIAPGNGARDRQILGVYVPPGSYPVGGVGDSVRVCLLSVPTKAANCDPSADARGREFLVYDRANNSAEVYQDGEHACGGA